LSVLPEADDVTMDLLAISTPMLSLPVDCVAPVPSTRIAPPVVSTVDCVLMATPRLLSVRMPADAAAVLAVPVSVMLPPADLTVANWNRSIPLLPVEPFAPWPVMKILPPAASLEMIVEVSTNTPVFCWLVPLPPIPVMPMLAFAVDSITDLF
jgi:hypothetical protein